MRSEMLPIESYQAVLLASQRSSQTGQVLLKVVRGRSERPRGRLTVQFSPLHAAKRRWPQFQSQPCARAKAEAERAAAQPTHHCTHPHTAECMAQGFWGHPSESEIELLHLGCSMPKPRLTLEASLFDRVWNHGSVS